MMALLSCLHLILVPGHVSRVIDGDTFILYTVGIPPEERVRLMGVDAVELKDSLGQVARSFTVEWLSRGSFTFDACKRDSFGRMLAVVARQGDTLAVDIIAAKLGRPF